MDKPVSLGRGVSARVAASDRARRRRLYALLGLLLVGVLGPLLAHHIVGEVVLHRHDGGGVGPVAPAAADPAVASSGRLAHAASDRSRPVATTGASAASGDARADDAASTPAWHVGALCAAALRALLALVHRGLHVLLAVGVLVAVWDRWRAWRRLGGMLRGLRAQPPVLGGRVWRAARAAGLATDRVRVVAGFPNPAFTAGWLRPMVYLAAELAERLSPAELGVVLAHEAAHVRRRDPLRLSALRFLGAVVFWLPALRRLTDDLADEIEFQADDAAAGDAPLVLAGALITVASTWCPFTQRTPGRWLPVAALDVAGIAAPDLLERRVLRLAGEPVPVCSRLTRWSTTGAVVALTLVAVSGAAALPSSNGHLQCAHHHGPFWTHLWCKPATSDGRCPHATAAVGLAPGADVPDR